MDLSQRIDPVLDVARESAREVDATASFPAETVTALRKSGLLGLTLPTEVGGLGGAPQDLVNVMSELAGACGSSAMIYLMHISAAMSVAVAPPPGLPDLLPGMASGDKLGSLAFSEAGSRSHFWAPVSQAQNNNGSGQRLNARKSWVTSAGQADVYVVSTLTADADTVDIFAVPADTDGITVDGEWHGLGLRGNASSPMTFGTDLPEDHRLGAVGSGFDLMMSTVMPWFNLGNASVSVGLSQAAVDAAVWHTSAAKFGASRPEPVRAAHHPRTAGQDVDRPGVHASLRRKGSRTPGRTGRGHPATCARRQGCGQRCRATDH